MEENLTEDERILIQNTVVAVLKNGSSFLDWLSARRKGEAAYSFLFDGRGSQFYRECMANGDELVSKPQPPLPLLSPAKQGRSRSRDRSRSRSYRRHHYREDRSYRRDRERRRSPRRSPRRYRSPERASRENSTRPGSRDERTAKMYGWSDSDDNDRVKQILLKHKN